MAQQLNSSSNNVHHQYDNDIRVPVFSNDLSASHTFLSAPISTANQIATQATSSSIVQSSLPNNSTNFYVDQKQQQSSSQLLADHFETNYHSALPQSFANSDFLSHVKQEEHDSTDCNQNLQQHDEYNEYYQPLEDHQHHSINNDPDRIKHQVSFYHFENNNNMNIGAIPHLPLSAVAAAATLVSTQQQQQQQQQQQSLQSQDTSQLTIKQKRIIKREKAKSRRKMTLESQQLLEGQQQQQQQQHRLTEELEPRAKQEFDNNISMCTGTIDPSMSNNPPTAWLLSSSSQSSSNAAVNNYSMNNNVSSVGIRSRSGTTTGGNAFDVKSEQQSTLSTSSSVASSSDGGNKNGSSRSSQMNDLLQLESKLMSGQITSDELQQLKLYNSSSNGITDTKQQKKIMQMIRNRISAQNSRDRKKAYINQLEKDNERKAQEIRDDLRATSSELQRQTEENQRLEEQIELLKQSLAEQEKKGEFLLDSEEGFYGRVQVFNEKPHIEEELDEEDEDNEHYFDEQKSEMIVESIVAPTPPAVISSDSHPPPPLPLGSSNSNDNNESGLCNPPTTIQPNQWITVTLPQNQQGKLTRITAQVDSVVQVVLQSH